VASRWTMASRGRAGAKTESVRVGSGRLRNAFGETGARHERVRATARGELAIARTPETTGSTLDGVSCRGRARPPGVRSVLPGGNTQPPRIGYARVVGARKIALFRSLFRGRDDVYAVRSESENGKSGYSPASIKDWDALRLVPKSEWKKRDKETRQLLSLTDAAVHNHLSGKITMGVYPLLPDETCWFLAVDFDQHTWKEDAAAFIDSCREWNVPAALERSRSGDGAHVWVFFAAPVTAMLARKLGAALLTRTMERRHQLGLRSYDRLFPNQDTMPHGGFGNLIALPPQKIPRKSGYSIFLDDSLQPIADQWNGKSLPAT